MTISERTQLFDENGVRIPDEDLEDHVVAPDWDIHINPVDIDPKNRLKELGEMYVWYRVFGVEKFWMMAHAIEYAIQQHPRLRGLLNGSYFPILLPWLPACLNMKSDFLPALRRSYRRAYPGRKILNHSQGNLSKLATVPESRFDILASDVKPPFVGMYFPDALRGWSVCGCREQMKTLPHDLKIILPDAFIHTIAYTWYPEVMADHLGAPVMQCAGNTWISPRYTLQFQPFDTFINFTCKTELSRPCQYTSGGLLVMY